MNIYKDKCLQGGSARITTGTNQFPSDEGALKAGGYRHVALVRMVGRRKEKEKIDDR